MGSGRLGGDSAFTVLRPGERYYFYWTVVFGLAELVVDWDALEGVLRGGRWVAVVGNPICVEKFIDDVSRLCGDYTLISQTPNVSLGVVRKCERMADAFGVPRESLNRVYFVFTGFLEEKRKCYSEIYLESLDNILNKILKDVKVASSINNNTEIIEPHMIDDVLNRVREKLSSGEWLLVVGESPCIFSFLIASADLCGEAPIAYRNPPSLVIALVKKCPALLKAYNEVEAAERLTEEGFKHLRALSYISSVYRDEDGWSRCEGVTYFSDEGVEGLLERVKRVISEGVT
jgi:hypothetical protein